MKRSLFFLIILTLLLTSCISRSFFNTEKELAKATLIGKVITEEGLPLEGVVVKLNDYQETFTDINGKFLFNYLIYGKHRIIFFKENYSSFEYNFVYNIKNRKIKPVKVKLYSLNFLIKKSFELLKEKNYEEVEKTFEKIETINGETEVFKYLKAVTLCKKKKYEEALPILEKLRLTDIDNMYYPLTLVDVYHELKLFEKEAYVCEYLGDNFKKEQAEYLKRAAVLYKEKLNDPEKYDKLMKQFEELTKEKEYFK